MHTAKPLFLFLRKSVASFNHTSSHPQLLISTSLSHHQLQSILTKIIAKTAQLFLFFSVYNLSGLLVQIHLLKNKNCYATNFPKCTKKTSSKLPIFFLFYILKFNLISNPVLLLQTNGFTDIHRLITISHPPYNTHIPEFLINLSATPFNYRKKKNTRCLFIYYVVKVNIIDEIEWQKRTSAFSLVVFNDLFKCGLNSLKKREKKEDSPKNLLK